MEVYVTEVVVVETEEVWRPWTHSTVRKGEVSVIGRFPVRKV